MDVNLKVYPNAQMTAQDFAILIEGITPFPDGENIIKGCEITRASASSIAISAGYVLVKGRIVEVPASTITVTLPSAQTTMHVQLTVDLGNVQSPGTIDIVTSIASDTGDFNIDNGVVHMGLGSFVATSSDITTVNTNDNRGRTRHIYLTTATPDNSKGNQGDLWFVYSNS